jgi:endonuclease YncB( thermonuclease family)
MLFVNPRAAIPLLFAVLLAAPTMAAADPRGVARVVDGDTLRVAGARIRLHGIDAPESGQTCIRDGKEWPAGRHAAAWLRSWIDGRTVTCRPETVDRYGRVVATCRVDGETPSLNETLVREGWATAYREFSDRYAGAEAEARAAGRGIWRARCEPPASWRRKRAGQGG